MSADVSEILPGLFVGGLSSLKYLELWGFTHVLSVVNFPIPKDLSAYVTLQLPLQDSPGANMLQYLPAAIKFLDAALGPAAAPAPAPAASTADSEAGVPAGGGCGGARVLVHCQAGVSRSPAVVAGWLMRSRGMSADAALGLLTSRRPCVDPNEGFRAQLSLFGDMRCSLDPDHPVYRMWCLEELASKWEDQGYVDPTVFGQLPDGPTGLSAALAAQQTLYRCRKCRQLLATSTHVMPVEAAMGHRIFRDRQRYRQVSGGGGADGSTGDGGGGGAESCLFLEPMLWMADTITGVVAGKLHCPKCSARLGSFNWSGISNPSGAWVTPAFLLHLSKLDTVLPKPLEEIANVRRPLVGPARGATAPAAAAAAAAVAASANGATAAAATAPSLPANLPAAVRRMGLGRAGAGEVDEGEEQLPEPQLVLDPDAPALDPVAAPAPGSAVSEPAAQPQAVAGAAAGGAEPQLGREGADGSSTTTTTTTSAAVSTDAGRCGGGAGGGEAGEGFRCRQGNGVGGGDGEAGRPRTAWFTHLILDCDGVMVDSEAASCEALRRAILEVTGFDIPHSFPHDYVEVFGMDVRSCVAHYRERFSRDEWAAPELLAPRVQAAKELHYKQLTADGIPAFDGAERLIRRALDAGMQVGVASSGAPEKIACNLGSSGLAPLIPGHAVVSAAQVAAGKPAPDVYLEAMRATGCRDPRRALVVEDAVNGLKAARAAGMFAVGITNQLPAALLGPWADLVVTHLDQVDPVGLTPTTATAL
ncbi:hypothetical protein PLESTB_000377800 [Pleodorina starrii]|uniref:protein-tyrosine-phosphatase n=1 Tax=Pleodorina starrii TaxID=330485 RepID=A0A9W6BET3_9CHLO|nr:hypothetical protein PLESTM_000017100 [Pleodorina starrii]GLC50423.1 hypothetical protein PLESTB_000377800 [Pleodorina starrii]GLC64195.1 hypothetical protein PLESTF_000134800 [Pleodorina starrii]